MDFTIPPELEELGQRIRTFVTSRIVPFETDRRWTDHGPTEDLRQEMVELARQEGVLAPHVGRRWGGMGLTHLGRAVAFEAAGWSILGPTALNCAAPDEGNMHLLEAVASEAQQERYLAPLARAEVRSCFAMTEPDGGAGSDPALLRTTARPDGDGGWVVDGTKWLITGANGAAFCIVMARMQGGAADGQATMFLTPVDAPGITVERTIDTMDSSFTGGHCVVRFEGLRVSQADVLGEAGEGFRYAQVRLAPARLTHCMRWLGSATRADEIARGYASHRHAFGRRIGEHEGVGFMLADNHMDIHVARLAIWHAAWILDQGGRGSMDSSVAKVVCSEAIWRVADRCVQVLGGLGITRDTVVERIFREARGFRIYDGPSEVHRWSIARRRLTTVQPKEAAAQPVVALAPAREAAE